MESEDQPQNRRARRASEKQGAQKDEPQEIKDRNQRLRAEVRGTKRKAQTGAKGPQNSLDAQERFDDALLRGTDAAGKFFGSHFNWLQYVIVLGALGGMGYLIWSYRAEGNREKRGDRLAKALDVSHGRLAADTAPKTSQFGLVDTRPEFADVDAKTKAAQEKWADIAAQDGATLGVFADLARAGTLYDTDSFEEATKAYQAVLDKPDAQKFPLALARAAEGVLLSYEALGNYDKALESVKRLQGVPGQAQLAMYHEARLAFLKGDVTRARELSASLREKLKKAEKPGADSSYLGAALSELEKTLDPKPKAAAGGLSPETLAALQKQLEEMQKNAPAGSGDEAPAPFDPTPLLPETGEGAPAPTEGAP